MNARIAAFVVWALAAAAAMYWVLRLLAAPAALPPSVETVSVAGALKGDIARLFASPVPASDAAPVAAEPVLASRFKLIGVVAGLAPDRGDGIALLAVDGKPPRPYRIGAPLGDDLVVQQVAARSVALGPAAGPVALRLDLPGLPPPATGRPGALAPPPPLALPGAALPAGLVAPALPVGGAGMQPGEGSGSEAVEQVEVEPPVDDAAEASPPVPGRRALR